MRKTSADSFPFVPVPGAIRECAVGWDKIAAELQRAISRSRSEKPIVVVECYPGVDERAVLIELQSRLAPKLTIHAREAYHPPERIEELVAPFLQSDNPPRVIGAGGAPGLSLVNFFDAEPLWRFRRTIDEMKGGLVLIVGCGASLIAWGNLLIYADLARREARRRFQGNEIGNVGRDNQSASFALKQKQASKIDWLLADRWKRPLIRRWNYVLDTHDPADPKLADAVDVRRGLQAATRRPFRLVCGDPNRESKSPDQPVEFVLEESSLLLDLAGLRMEVPAINLLLHQPRALLGEAVHIRFGYEFPIRLGTQNTTASLSEPISHGDGWREERVGWDERASIELCRQWLSKTVAQDTQGGVNMLQLIQGDEAIIESPERAFEPFVVHAGIPVIIPAAVRPYNIRPHGLSAGKEIVILKALVRIQKFGSRMP